MFSCGVASPSSASKETVAWRWCVSHLRFVSALRCSTMPVGSGCTNKRWVGNRQNIEDLKMKKALKWSPAYE